MTSQVRSSQVISTLTLAWLSHFFVDLMLGIFPVYKTMAGIDLATAGLIAATCPFIGEGMQVVFGSLGDKGYRKILLLLGLAATTASAFFSYSTWWPVIFLLYFITCMGSGAFHPSAVAITSSLTQKRRALFVTIFASGGYLGLALSQIVFSETYIATGGQTAILAIPSFLLFAFIAMIGFHGKGSMIAPAGRRYGFSAFKKLFGCKPLVNLYLLQVCNQAVFWGVIFLLPDVLHSRGYDTWISLGGGHLFFILGCALMIVPGGHLADKSSPKYVLLGATLIGAILFYLFLFVQMPPAQTLAILFLTGAAMGVTNPVAVALGNHILPSRPGLVSAFLMGMVWCLSEGIGPGGGGLLTKLFVEDAPAKALSILGLLFIFSLYFATKLPPEVLEEYDLDKDH